MTVDAIRKALPDEGFVEKYLLLFEKQPVFASHTTQLLTFVYLRQLTLFEKALRHALYCPLHSTLGVK